MLFGGVLAVFVAVLVATAGVPLPAELAIIYGGHLAASGQAPLWVVLVVGWIGSLAGALVLYGAARSLGREAFDRYGRKLGVSGRQLRAAERFFERGGWTVALARFVPGLRTVVSVPAGIARMPLASFIAWSAAGLAPATAMLVGVGWILDDQWEAAGSWTTAIAVGIGILAATATAVAWWRAQQDDEG